MPPKQRTKKRTKKKTKKSDWIKFVKKYAKEHQVSYGDAMIPAGVEWQLRKEGNSSTTKSRKKAATPKKKTKKAAKKAKKKSSKKELNKRCKNASECVSQSCRRKILKDGKKSKNIRVCMKKQKKKRKKKRFEDHRFPIM